MSNFRRLPTRFSGMASTLRSLAPPFYDLLTPILVARLRPRFVRPSPSIVVFTCRHYFPRYAPISSVFRLVLIALSSLVILPYDDLVLLPASVERTIDDILNGS